MINLCLDTNVYLSFYHFSDNDLQKLEEILTLIEEGDLNIILPEQIKNEFFRNREVKIGDALKRLKEMRIDFKLPRIVDSYDETKELSKLFKTYTKQKESLIEKVEIDINNNSLKADILIQKIFKKAEYIPLTGEIWDKSKKRFDLGNPPGKDKSYGDAIVRETLLSYKDNKIDIDFVSIDGDYICALDDNKLNSFLQIERDNIKEGKILFYSKLNSFFEKYFPGIRINEEYLKNKYVEKFTESYSFDNVRYNIGKLMKFENYSLEQINKIIEGAISNEQVWRCKEYSAWVSEELVKIIMPYFDKITDFGKLMKFLEIYDYKTYSTIRDEYEAEFYPRDQDESYERESF